MSMKEPGHQILESQTVIQPLKDIPAVMSNNATVQLATSECLVGDRSPTQTTPFSPLTMDVDALSRMRRNCLELENDNYIQSLHSKPTLDEQRAPSRKSKWMRVIRMQLNSMRAQEQKLQQQKGHRTFNQAAASETDRSRAGHLFVRRNIERPSSSDERSKDDSPSHSLIKRTAVSTQSLASHHDKIGSPLAADQEVTDSPTGMLSPTLVSPGSGNELTSKHSGSAWIKRTANVRGRLSSFWRQAALAALRNQSRVNQAPVDSKPVNASLSILNELFPESWPTANQVERWQDSFQNLLQDEDGLRVFREFLRGEFSDENIEFWIACQQYKSLEVGTKSRVQAQRIYDQFIAFQSQREVNLDCETRLQTESRLSEAGPDLFDTCQRRIEALMEKDPYIRFLRSTLYYKLKEVTGVSGTASAHQNSISTTVLDYGHPNKLVTSSPLHHDTPLVLCLPQISIPAKPVASRSPAYRVKEDVSNKGLAKDANETAFGAPYSPFLDAIIVHSSSCSPSVISLRRKTRENHEQARHSIDLSHMAIQ
uniref:Regulator of G-protein signaling 8 n=1 Tax=Schistocephalus solidus TaxID=70667 RepID=A0A0X3PMS1_SCHSO